MTTGAKRRWRGSVSCGGQLGLRARGSEPPKRLLDVLTGLCGRQQVLRFERLRKLRDLPLFILRSRREVLLVHRDQQWDAADILLAAVNPVVHLVQGRATSEVGDG